MKQPIYQDVFKNPPVTKAYLNFIGPEGLFEWLEAKFRSLQWPDDLKRASFKQRFSDHLRPMFGEQLDTSKISAALSTVLYDAGLDKLLVDDTPKRESIRYRLLRMATDIHALDHQSRELERQIARGKIDQAELNKKYYKELARDPRFVVHGMLNNMMGRSFTTEPWNQHVFELLTISVGRIAMKECRKDINWVEKQSGQQTEHIMDWLKAAVINNDSWLYNLDAQGRPKKLMKFGSLEAMEAEANKGMRRKFTQERPLLHDDDEEVFARDGGDFFVIRLKTPRALDVESNAMRHCIGHGAYDESLNRSDRLYLSLRDRRNHACATIEVHADKIVQFRGKANHDPKEIYREAVQRLLTPLGIEFQKTERIENLCMEIDIEGVPTRIYDDGNRYSMFLFT